MPGYGVRGPDEGAGLLPWSWARERLLDSRHYWVVTLWPDGRPHAMPVWGIWSDDSFWFSSSVRSRKTRNVGADPRCVVTIEDALDPVVMEGTARVITDMDAVARFLELINAKYETDYALEFLDPAVNATIEVRPGWAFGLLHDDFSGSPTRWVFP
jgi:PPOX class probable F420-dependent enzyme